MFKKDFEYVKRLQQTDENEFLELDDEEMNDAIEIKAAIILGLGGVIGEAEEESIKYLNSTMNKVMEDYMPGDDQAFSDKMDMIYAELYKTLAY